MEMRPSWIRVGPKFNDKCSSKGRKGKKRQEDTQRRDHVKSEAEMEVMCLQAREGQGLPGATKWIHLWSFKKEAAVLTP